MRKAFLVSAFIAAFVLAVFATNAAPAANFAGAWSLDKAKSTGLSQGMASADSVTWTITQDDKTISIDSKVTGGQTGGGTGGGTGTGGGRGAGGPRVYNLDGKEVTAEAGGQMGGTNTTKATWSGDGKSLELSSVRTGNFNGNDFKSTSLDKLSLSGDGKVLTVVRHSESPRGTTDSTLLFNKQ
jgi:hypothetical protein